MEDPSLLEDGHYYVLNDAIVTKITTKDRKQLRVGVWQPTDNLTADGTANGTICVFHGFSEHIEKYFEVVGCLRRRGFVVVAMDWRGHGLSDRYLKNRAKGYVWSFNGYQQDIDALIEQIVKPQCPPPFYALAHSMGGHNLFRACGEGRGAFFRRVVLCAPMLYLAPANLIGFHWLLGRRATVSTRIVSQKLTRILACSLRAMGFGRLCASGGITRPQAFETNLLTSDETRFDRNQRLIADAPELHINCTTFAWLHAACNSIRKTLTPRFIANIDVPILMIAAGDDQVVSTPAIEKIGQLMRVGHCLVIPGAKHEILQECDTVREQFWAAFDAFIPGSDAVK